MSDWQIITGEYPPKLGGVADYTRLVARELARAGERVNVWVPSCAEKPVRDAGVAVYLLPDHFGPRALSVLSRFLDSSDPGSRILIQYVPHALGLKAMNLPFCMWLWSRRRHGPIVMFHEVAFPARPRQPLRHKALAATTRLMAAFAARAAGRVLVSTPAWESALRPMLPRGRQIEWLPVPSGIAVARDPATTAAVRRRYAASGALVGHFGTYAPAIAEQLRAALPVLLEDKSVNAMLLGRNAEKLRDTLATSYAHLAPRIHCPGVLPSALLSRHIRACDLMVQPYPDGASTRRTTLMAALAHGVSVVTTAGPATEPLWRLSGAVALADAGDTHRMVALTRRLLAHPIERARLAAAGTRLYWKRFDIRHTVQALLNDSSCSAGRAAHA